MSPTIENCRAGHYTNKCMSLSTPYELEKFLQDDPHVENEEDDMFMGNFFSMKIIKFESPDKFE